MSVFFNDVWQFILKVLPLILTIGGGLIAHQGVVNQKDPTFKQRSATDQNLYGTAHTVGGGILAVAGAALIGHKLVKPTSAAPPAPTHPLAPITVSSDPASQKLFKVKQDISDDWQQRITAMSAESTKQMAQVDALLAQREAMLSQRKAGP